MLAAVSTPLATPQTSHAALGGVASLFVPPVGIPAVIVGGVLAGGSLVVATGFCMAYKFDGLTCVYAYFLTLPFVLKGALIMNPEQDPATFEFAELSEDAARELGISKPERSSYNEELEEINAVRESIQAELNSRLQSVGEVSSLQAHELWQAHRDLISPDAYSALEKISARFHNSAQAQSAQAK